MQQLLEDDSVFNKKAVIRFAEKHIDVEEREVFLGQFWSSKELVLVAENLYTSKTVLREEQKLLRMAARLAGKSRFIVEPRHEIELNAEQKRVIDYVCRGSNLTCIEGRAGTGKSRALCAVRDTYEAEGYIVRGLAPTSSVAHDMQQNGFKYSYNVHSFLYRQYHDRLKIAQRKEIWLVDEAAMVPNPVMGELLDVAWRNNAKVVLIGDEKQLCAIGRGGAFKACVERFGSVSLEQIVRQKDEHCRVITENIAAGKIREALFQMNENGAWNHKETEQEAIQNMMNIWYENYKKQPQNSFVLLEYRNEYVRLFNSHIHDVLQARGELGSDNIKVNTARYGFMNFSMGDSIVFRANNAELGMHNGQRGILIAADRHRFVVQINDNQSIEFDPYQYTDFQHGYAGTIHSTQGLTFDYVYTLHSHHVDQRLFYVANSRHKLSCHYFSYGDQARVYQDVSRLPARDFCSESLKREVPHWLTKTMYAIRDYMCKNHEFYQNPYRQYHERGVLITNIKENARMPGYRT